MRERKVPLFAENYDRREEKREGRTFLTLEGGRKMGGEIRNFNDGEGSPISKGTFTASRGGKDPEKKEKITYVGSLLISHEKGTTDQIRKEGCLCSEREQ